MRSIYYEYSIMYILCISSILLSVNIIKNNIHCYLVAVTLALANGLTIFVDHSTAYFSFHWLFETTKKDNFLDNM